MNTQHNYHQDALSYPEKYELQLKLIEIFQQKNPELKTS